MVQSIEKSGRVFERQCIFWYTVDYDDEQTLLHLRQLHPTFTWKKICDFLNEKEAADRRYREQMADPKIARATGQTWTCC